MLFSAVSGCYVGTILNLTLSSVDSAVTLCDYENADDISWSYSGVYWTVVDHRYIIVCPD